MARLSRAEIFDPSEIVAVHTMARTNRRCFLLGDDQFTGKNFDHRKRERKKGTQHVFGGVVANRFWISYFD